MNRLILAWLLVAGLPLAAQEVRKDRKAAGHPGVDSKKVDAAIEKGTAFLRGRLGDMKEDCMELVLWTFVHAGVRKGDPHYDALFKGMISRPLQTTYRVSLQAMILEEVDRVTHQERIADCAQFLVDNQGPNGQWGYGTPTTYDRYTPVATGSPRRKEIATASKARDFSKDPSSKPDVRMKIVVQKKRDGQATDNSNSQYAALGLRACHDAGIVLPKEVLERAQGWLRGAQCSEEAKSGYPARGWCYRGKDYSPAYGSMTAGSAGALTIYDYILNDKLSWKADKDVLSGIGWLANHFSVTENPNVDKAVGSEWSVGEPNGAQYYYYLYALERLGMLYGTERIGRHEWYPEGANVLLKVQQGDGSWPARDVHRNSVWDTCFAVLFLKRATRPLNDVATGDSR